MFKCILLCTTSNDEVYVCDVETDRFQTHKERAVEMPKLEDDAISLLLDGFLVQGGADGLVEDGFQSLLGQG